MIKKIFCDIRKRLAYHQGSPLNLLGDRDIEWSWIASQMPSGPGFALDFGNGGTNFGLTAVQRGFDVIAVDLQNIEWPYEHERLHFLRGDILKNVGLAGRYDVNESHPDGDLEAMSHLKIDETRWHDAAHGTGWQRCHGHAIT